MKRKVNGKYITIGQQNFNDNTISIKDDRGNTLHRSMLSDEDGNIFFVYDKTIVYLSDHLGNMPL